MTAHELEYCRFLLQQVRDLYIEKAAMSTLLDHSQQRPSTAPPDWRSVVRDMTTDEVFRSAVEANHAPYLEKLKLALRDEKALASLMRSL
jgi:hypothetical protein